MICQICGKVLFCVGTGNEAASAGHTSGRLLQENTETVIELAVQENQPALNVQIWKEYTDVVEISDNCAIRSSKYADCRNTWNTKIHDWDRQNCLFIMGNRVHTVLHRKSILIFCR